MNISNETKILLSIIIGTVLLIGGGIYYLSKSAPVVAKDTVEVEKTLSKENYSKGNKDSKVKIVEYSDFQCPACGASEPVVQQMLKEYGDRVYFEYSHFPLSMHRWSIEAAEAAELAGEQNKFWEMHNMLFAKQAEWSEVADAGVKFKAFATGLKLDTKKFSEGYDSHKFRQKVLDATKRGEAIAVSSTPTFFINGERVVGGVPFETWKKILDEKLK